MVLSKRYVCDPTINKWGLKELVISTVPPKLLCSGDCRYNGTQCFINLRQHFLGHTSCIHAVICTVHKVPLQLSIHARPASVSLTPNFNFVLFWTITLPPQAPKVQTLFNLAIHFLYPLSFRSCYSHILCNQLISTTFISYLTDLHTPSFRFISHSLALPHFYTTSIDFQATKLQFLEFLGIYI